MWLKNAVRNWTKRRQVSAELDEEVRGYVEMLAEEKMRRGAGAREAQREAKMETGGVEQVKEQTREIRAGHLLETLWQDIRYGGRMLRKSPGFTAVAVLTLALGIGANTAVFSAAHAVLWSTLPVANPQNLVVLAAVRKDGTKRDDLPISVADELQRSSRVLSDVIASDADGLSLSFNGGRAERAMGEAVSPNYFSFLGIRPILGQGFSLGVRRGQWAAEVVLSYRFWQRRFGGDPRVLGRTVTLNDVPFTIVGISPASFYSLQVGFEPDLILPRLPRGQGLSQMNLLSGADVATMARLRPGVGIMQAQAAVDAQARRLLQTDAGSQQELNPIRGIRLQAGDKGWKGLGQFREPLWLLLGLGGLVLLIASTNLASMLLARATVRSRELALRAALGAGRGRLVRQMVTESALLSLAGGLAGFAAMSRADNVLLSFLPQSNIQIVLNLKPDFAVVWFALCLTLLTVVLLGLIPALQATRPNLMVALNADSGASVGSSSGARTRNTLVSGQVALSLLLLVVAGLLWQTLGKLRASDVFPRPDRVLLFTIKPQVELYNSGHMRNLTTEIASRTVALPGVESAALAENGPLGLRSDHAVVQNSRGETIRVAADLVMPGYFRTIGVPLLAGRDFSFADDDNAHPEAIVNQALSRQLFRNGNPLEKIINAPPDSLRTYDMQGPLKVVGVVKSVRYYDLHQASPPAIYLNMQQGTAYMPTLHVRVAPGANPADVIAEVRREFNAIDTNFPVFDVKTLANRANDSLARERLVSELAGSFGFLALLLVALGLYAVMAFTVARRSREIGIRMALGAEESDVLKLVLGQGLKLTIIGVGFGLIVTLGVTQSLSSLLYGVTPGDPLTFIVVSVLLGIVALAACYIPARRAMKVDPMVALRYE